MEIFQGEHSIGIPKLGYLDRQDGSIRQAAKSCLIRKVGFGVIGLGVLDGNLKVNVYGISK